MIASDGGKQFGEHHRHEARFLKKTEGFLSASEREEPVDFLQHARGRCLCYFGVMFEDGIPCGRFDSEAEARREPYCPHHSYGVLTETDFRVADGSYRSGVQIGEAADMVDDAETLYVVEDSIDREIAPSRVFLGCAESVVAFVEFAGFEVTIGLAPERAGFYYLGSELYVGETKASSYEKAVSEEFPDLLRVGVGADIEVLRFSPQKQVPDAASDQVCGVTGVMQAVENTEGIGIDVLARYGVVRPGDYPGCRIRTGRFATHIRWDAIRMR